MNNTSIVYRLLERIEYLGNRLPHPTLLFVYLCFFILLLSGVAAFFELSAEHPVTGEVIQAVNLFSQNGLHRILSKAVTNFTHFAPVGTVLVAVMGIGVAEHSGLLSVVLKSLVLKAPAKLLSFFVVCCGVLSSLAADTGYVVLIPLAAVMFMSAGRHPVVGIAAAFAGVSGGFSANLLIGPFDAVLAGISTEAAQLVAPSYEVTAAANYYFIFASTFVIGIVGAWVTDNIVSPRFDDSAHEQTDVSLSDVERHALKRVAWFTYGFIGLLLWGLLPEGGILRSVSDGSVLRSPFMQGIVVVIAFYAAIAGLIYGRCSGHFGKEGLVEGMEKSMTTMASYLVLMFFAAQFVSYFSWSQLGIITAINGAGLLQTLELNSAALLVAFVFLAAFINLLIGSASAKWALLAPVFVPMFFLVGISPEAAQVAFRIGDSTTNIITPLMPYFGVVVAFVQKYDPRAGVGTIIATMLPYSVAFLLVWTLMFAAWILLGLPLGPGVETFIG